MTHVIAIGNFDGVHRGHQAILAAAREAAGAGTVTALTFWPHPLAVLRPDAAPDLLCDIEERIGLLHRYGADDVSIVEFTPGVAALTPEQFVDQVLVPLRPTAVVVGENFRFGVGARADGVRMAELAGARFSVDVRPMLGEDGPVSSSRIRTALLAGDPTAAGQMLGRWFRYAGIVILGDQRGRALGFPTANLAVPPGKACPADGVYAGYLSAGPDRWPAAISVGTNPTFDAVRRRVEAYALDETTLKLYGERVTVDFVAHVRTQRRFASKEELIEAMTADVATTRRLLAAADTPGANAGAPFGVPH